MMQRADRSNKLRPRLQCIDMRKLRLNGLHAERVNRCGVHARSEVVANLLLNRSAILRFRVSFKDAPQKLLVLVAELRIDAPARLVGGDRVVLLPAAAGELIEVHTGVYRAVEAGDVERG